MEGPANDEIQQITEAMAKDLKAAYGLLYDDVQREIADGIEAGEGYEEIMKRIDGLFVEEPGEVEEVVNKAMDVIEQIIAPDRLDELQGVAKSLENVIKARKIYNVGDVVEGPDGWHKKINKHPAEWKWLAPPGKRPPRETGGGVPGRKRYDAVNTKNPHTVDTKGQHLSQKKPSRVRLPGQSPLSFTHSARWEEARLADRIKHDPDRFRRDIAKLRGQQGANTNNVYDKLQKMDDKEVLEYARWLDIKNPPHARARNKPWTGNKPAHAPKAPAHFLTVDFAALPFSAAVKMDRERAIYQLVRARQERNKLPLQNQDNALFQKIIARYKKMSPRDLEGRAVMYWPDVRLLAKGIPLHQKAKTEQPVQWESPPAPVVVAKECRSQPNDPHVARRATGKIFSYKEQGGGINPTYKTVTDTPDGQVTGIYKPWDGKVMYANGNAQEQANPHACDCEVTAYKFDRMIGLNRVPNVTRLTQKIKYMHPTKGEKQVNVEGSFMEFAEDCEIAGSAAFWHNEISLDETMRCATFDYLINHEDRHKSNWMINMRTKQAVLIDNGYSQGNWYQQRCSFVDHPKIKRKPFQCPPDLLENLKKVDLVAVHDMFVAEGRPATEAKKVVDRIRNVVATGVVPEMKGE